jgi:hypothetical protein
MNSCRLIVTSEFHWPDLQRRQAQPLEASPASPKLRPARTPQVRLRQESMTRAME